MTPREAREQIAQRFRELAADQDHERLVEVLSDRALETGDEQIVEDNHGGLVLLTPSPNRMRVWKYDLGLRRVE